MEDDEYGLHAGLTSGREGLRVASVCRMGFLGAGYQSDMSKRQRTADQVGEISKRGELIARFASICASPMATAIPRMEEILAGMAGTQEYRALGEEGLAQIRSGADKSSICAKILEALGAGKEDVEAVTGENAATIPDTISLRAITNPVGVVLEGYRMRIYELSSAVRMVTSGAPMIDTTTRLPILAFLRDTQVKGLIDVLVRERSFGAEGDVADHLPGESGIYGPVDGARERIEAAAAAEAAAEAPAGAGAPSVLSPEAREANTVLAVRSVRAIYGNRNMLPFQKAREILDIWRVDRSEVHSDRLVAAILSKACLITVVRRVLAEADPADLPPLVGVLLLEWWRLHPAEALVGGHAAAHLAMVDASYVFDEDLRTAIVNCASERERDGEDWEDLGYAEEFMVRQLGMVTDSSYPETGEAEIAMSRSSPENVPEAVVGPELFAVMQYLAEAPGNAVPPGITTGAIVTGISIMSMNRSIEEGDNLIRLMEMVVDRRDAMAEFVSFLELNPWLQLDGLMMSYMKTMIDGLNGGDAMRHAVAQSLWAHRPSRAHLVTDQFQAIRDRTDDGVMDHYLYNSFSAAIGDDTLDLDASVDDWMIFWGTASGEGVHLKEIHSRCLNLDVDNLPGNVRMSEATRDIVMVPNHCSNQYGPLSFHEFLSSITFGFHDHASQRNMSGAIDRTGYYLGLMVFSADTDSAIYALELCWSMYIVPHIMNAGQDLRVEMARKVLEACDLADTELPDFVPLIAACTMLASGDTAVEQYGEYAVKISKGSDAIVLANTLEISGYLGYPVVGTPEEVATSLAQAIGAPAPPQT